MSFTSNVNSTLSRGMEDFKHYRILSSHTPNSRHKRYHVFLSFRGADVRKTLVDHLFQSLSTAGLHVFLDSERLEKGENIGISLQRAIQSSAIHIPIFSVHYARFPWCLKELSLMWDFKSVSTGTTIIPLFYNVEPSDVRYPDKKGGQYAEAFHNHYTQGRHKDYEITAWKTALCQVSSLSGWSLSETAFGGNKERDDCLAHCPRSKKLQMERAKSAMRATISESQGILVTLGEEEATDEDIGGSIRGSWIHTLIYKLKE